MTKLFATQAPDPDDFNLTVSAIQEFIRDNRAPPNTPHPPESYNLALQIAHNLRFQHNWTDIRVHFNGSNKKSSLPRPVLSGLPPQRLYVHPDEQIEVLQRQRERGKSGLPLLESEREWVLPSHLRETWTLKRFAQVFDGLAQVPSDREGGQLKFASSGQESGTESVEQSTLLTGIPSGDGPRNTTAEQAQPASLSEKMQTDEDGQSRSTATETAAAGTMSDAVPSDTRRKTSERAERTSEWRTQQPKRMLLATLDDDSTVVYYIIHDGIVKPRQN